jgi:Methyltransferase domain
VSNLTHLKRKLANLLANHVSSLLPKIANNKEYFQLWEKKGFHITPIHFYEPIPDTRTLKNELWETESELPGINKNTEKQLKLLTQVFTQYKEEYNFPQKQTPTPYEYYYENNFFPQVDADVLYALTRHFKPKKIIEVGSGLSTYIMAKACLLNTEKNDVKTDYTIIDPFPNETVKKGIPGVTNLIQKPVEQVPLDPFLMLGENDILFIDSSHVARIGGDVNYLFLQVLPRINKGVVVHIHDVFLPFEYPKNFVLKYYMFWSEQYLLQAFLSFNSEFEVLWAGYYMQQKHPEECKLVFPSFTERKEKAPGSFWIRRKKKENQETEN